MKHALLVLVIALSHGLQQAPDVASRFNHALQLQQRGALEEAAAEYQALILAQPTYMEAHANLGVILAQQGHYEEAIASYEAALRLSPELPPLLLNLGITHYRAGQFERAVDLLQRLTDYSANSMQARQLLGISLVELGRDSDAIPHLEFALEATPDDPAVLYALGLAYLRLKKPDVRSIVERLSGLPSGVGASHLLSGESLLAGDDYGHAITELEAAAKLNAELPRLQYSLGLCYLKLARYKEAVSSFELELRRKPLDFSSLYYLAYVHEAAGNLGIAREKAGRALALEPESPEANALLGKILTKQGRLAEAVAPLEKAVARDPVDPNKRYLLARTYKQLGRDADAAREFEEVERLKLKQLENDRAHPYKH